MITAEELMEKANCSVLQVINFVEAIEEQFMLQ
jgi:hypothetical protein